MVNYNGERYLPESLGSVYSQKDRFKEILLIDNASEDRSLEIVRTRFPDVKITCLDRNRGPGRARNVALRAAACDLILFVDNDVSLAPDCPDRLLEALTANTRVSVAMARVLYAQTRDVIQYDGAETHFLGHMTLNHSNVSVQAAPKETREIGSVVTACFLIDRAKWRGTDPFDDAFFFCYEDHDFGLRTRVLGHKILSVPSALCYQREGTEGLSLRYNGRYSKQRVRQLIRNRWHLILKSYDFRTMVFLSPILFAYEVFQIMGVIKKGWFREWFGAFSWIVVHFPGILEKRRIVQKERETPDREILSDGPLPFTELLTASPLERAAKNLFDSLAGVYWKNVERFI